MLAVDLIAWTQHLLLHGDLAKAEPKTLRYRLLHVAARLTRGQRRLWLRIQRTWPWARDLAAGVRPARRATRPDRLTFDPDTTSSGATGRTSTPATSPRPSPNGHRRSPIN